MRSVTYTPRLAFSIQLREQNRAEGPGACPHIPGAICPPLCSQKASEMAEVVWLQPDGTSTLHPFQQGWVKTADNKQIYQERYLREEIFTRYPQHIFLDRTSRAPGHANRGPGLVRPASALPTPSLMKNSRLKTQFPLHQEAEVSFNSWKDPTTELGGALPVPGVCSRSETSNQPPIITCHHIGPKHVHTHRKEGDVTQISKSA